MHQNISPLIFRQTWQARRDLNPQPSDLESAALPIRATGLLYFDSLCATCFLQREQNFLSLSEPIERFFETR